MTFRFLSSVFYIIISILTAHAYEPLIFPSADISHIGIYIEDIATGKVVTSYNDAKVLVPASVMKSVTAASVQSIIAPDFRFITKVYPAGKILAGVLNGNLIVKGSGDPTLGSRFFADTQPDFVKQVVNHVRKLGIDSISGDILMDESCITSPGISPYWLQEDFGWEYGTGLFGINFRDNSFSMTITPGHEPKVSAIDVEVDNLTRKTGTDDVMAMRGYDSSLLTITGSIPKSYGSRFSLPSPSAELYAVLTTALGAAGIQVGANILDNEPDADISKCLNYKSPSRDDILRVMMHKSDNLYAEGMLHTLSKTAKAAVKREKDLWTSNSINLAGSRWLDGSGLSPVERISPRTLGCILSFMARHVNSSAYVALFPVAGREGTVKSLLKNTRLEGQLALKSGSMNGVKCYAGYKIDTYGRPTHTVVIMVNGFSCKGAAVAKAIEDYLVEIL